MKFFTNLGVRRKLIAAFSIICIFIALSGGEGILSSGIINKNAKKMYSTNLISIKDLQSIKSNLNYNNTTILEIIFQKNKSTLDEEIKTINRIINQNKEFMKEYESLSSTQEEKDIYSNFKEDLLKYMELESKVIDLVEKNNYDEAAKLYNSEITTIRSSMLEKLEKCVNINVKSAEEANLSNIEQFNRIKYTIIIYTAITFIIIILIAYILINNIINPLNKIKDLAQRLSNYDFSSPISVTRKDEFGQTSLALNNAQENVSNLVKMIMENSEDISASSEELSATVEELLSKAEIIDEAVNNITAGIQESSATSEEISASVQEVDESINVLASNAMEGSNNANKSKERAKEVKNNSEKAIEETGKIYVEKQSNMEKAIEEGKIVDSIMVMADTIGGIAEQTNLLALNAAIEAARVGEQGKGFAVVAEEIRKLAEESKESVINIQETITKVQAAFKSSIDTGSDILKFITTNVYEQFKAYKETGNQYHTDSDLVSKMSDEIASMSEEITATVGQVSEAIQNMAEASQKSSEEAVTIKGSMDEATKAMGQVALTAQSQAELAQRLNEMIQKFKI